MTAYLDANCVIYLVEQNPVWGPRIGGKVVSLFDILLDASRQEEGLFCRRPLVGTLRGVLDEWRSPSPRLGNVGRGDAPVRLRRTSP